MINDVKNLANVYESANAKENLSIIKKRLRFKKYSINNNKIYSKIFKTWKI